MTVLWILFILSCSCFAMKSVYFSYFENKWKELTQLKDLYKWNIYINKMTLSIFLETYAIITFYLELIKTRIIQIINLSFLVGISISDSNSYYIITSSRRVRVFRQLSNVNICCVYQCNFYVISHENGFVAY